MRNTGKNRKKRIEQNKEQHTNKGKLENVSRGITMHDKIEQPVHEAEMRYRALFENANDAIFLMEADKFVECNPKILEMFGCTSGQIIGKTPYDPYSPKFQPEGRESKDKALEKIQLALQGQPQFFEWRHVRYDGSAFDAEVSLNRLELSGKTFIQAIVRNISERKQLEDKLKNSEEKYKTLVEHINEMIFMHDFDGKLTYVSPQCEKITGYTAQDLIGQQWTSYATDNPINKLALNIFEKVKKTGQSSELHQIELLKKEGDAILLEVSDTLLRNAEGMAIGIVGSARDITNQKLMEKALRESEQRLSSLIEAAPSVIMLLSPDHQILEFNPEAERLYGKKREDVLGKNYLEMFLPEEARDMVARDIEKVLAGEPTRDFENAVRAYDGTKRILSWNVNRILDSKDQPIGIVTIGQDVTERKKTQEALKESLQTSDDIVQAIPSGLFIYQYEEPDKLILMNGNPEAERLTGIKISDCIGKEFNQIWPAAQESGITEDFLGPMKTGKTFETEDLHYKDKRLEGAFRIRAFRLPADRLAVAFENITERKRADEALRQSEERLTKAFQASPNLMGIIDLDEQRRLIVNDAFARVTGYSREEVTGTTFNDLQLQWVEPDRVHEAFRFVRKDGVIQDYEADIRTKHGEIRTLRYNGALLDIPGKNIVIFSAEDITERREAESRIQEYQAQLKSLASELTLAEERERRRIAVGLHDDIAQKLAMAKFSLQSLQSSVADSDLSQSLEKQCQVMEQIVEDARSLTFELSNPILYQVGLEAALESYLSKQIQDEFGIECIFKSEGPQSSLGDDIKVVLFQAVRELLANIIKHANASTLEVCITNSGDELKVVVEDDGVGFDPARISPHGVGEGGFGLFNIRERLEYLGGNLKIESQQKKGTRVIMSIPIKADAVA